MIEDTAIAAAILACLASRASDASICPSEVARALQPGDPAWRQVMPQVRHVAADLVQRRVIRATQGERGVPSSGVPMAVGPIRLRRGDLFPAER